MEYRRFAQGESPVSTFDYHKDRERAPHREQGTHQARMSTTIQLVGHYLTHFWRDAEAMSVVDLGCGDGGTLQMLGEVFGAHVITHGYDFQPANAAGWTERGVTAEALSFVDDWELVAAADLFIMTEVLEHLEDPYGAVRRVTAHGSALVCSSPWVEYEGSIDASHNWAWDMPGYIAMLEACGMRVVESRRATWSQVHLAVPA